MVRAKPNPVANAIPMVYWECIYIVKNAVFLCVILIQRGNGATVAREIPDLKVGGSNPSFLKNT